MHLKNLVRPLVLSLGVGWGAAGCGPNAPGPAAAPPPVLGFGHHAVSPVRYEVTDSSLMSIATPMGDLAVRARARSVLDVVFADHADGTMVTATVAEYEAEAENDMVGTTTEDLDDLEGPLVFVIDDRGAADVLSVPEASGEAGSGVRFAGMAHSLFPRLPGEAVEPGFSWTDTVTWSFEEDEVVSTTTVYRYAFVGDTVVDGRRMAMIDVDGEGETVVEADAEGMRMTTTVTGTLTGAALWDWSRGILHSLSVDQEADGTGRLDMPGVPPFNIEYSDQLRVQLAPSAGGSP